MTDVRVRLQPRGGRNEVVGERGEVIVLRVAAPAIDGRANQAMCELLAERAGIPRSAVRIVAGEKSRDMIVRVEGVGMADLRAALGLD